MRIFAIAVPDQEKPIRLRAERLVTEGQNAIFFGEGATVVAALGLHPGIVIVDEEWLESAGVEEEDEQ